MALEIVDDAIRRTSHRHGDDLLSAGLGLAGLAGRPTPFADPLEPTPEELRRRAIQTAWKGIADLGPLGGYGRLYGRVPAVPGREYGALARLPRARQPHRLLCQIPDAFDPAARCLVIGPASGSRGVYGGMALAGAWALPRGCAVAYTDKGAGAGYFDCGQATGAALDGTRAHAGDNTLEFEPGDAPADAGIAAKHAHSGDNPEADWGRHVLQAVDFGLAMLDEACPEQAPFTRANTRIIAVGISNGGGAVLQAAGLDDADCLDGVVALAPNVHADGHGRALFDYASEAALWLPAALTAEHFADTPLARLAGAQQPPWLVRLASLQLHGLLPPGSPAATADAALERLHASGWRDTALATAASSVSFDLWRGVAATYASAYSRSGAGHMPGGFSFRAVDVPGAPSASMRAAWWADGTGIPPHPGIGLFGGVDLSADPTLPGVLALRALWDENSSASRKLHAGVEAVTASLPRADLPVWLVHGEGDGLIPAAFTSDGYAAWLRQHGRAPRYWCVPHAQHFDAFLQVSDFGARHVPLLPYGYRALDAMYAHVVHGRPLPDAPTPQARPRGPDELTAEHLDLPG